MNPSIYCVDLDKTLIEQDTTLELIKTEIRNNPKIIFNLIVALYHHEWRGFKSETIFNQLHNKKSSDLVETFKIGIEVLFLLIPGVVLEALSALRGEGAVLRVISRKL